MHFEIDSQYQLKDTSFHDSVPPVQTLGGCVSHPIAIDALAETGLSSHSTAPIMQQPF